MYHFPLAEIAFNGTLRKRIAKLFSAFFFLNKNTITFFEFTYISGDTRKIFHKRKRKKSATNSVTQLVECRPAKQKVAVSIPGQGTYLGWGFGPRMGGV